MHRTLLKYKLHHPGTCLGKFSLEGTDAVVRRRKMVKVFLFFKNTSWAGDLAQ